MNPEALVLIKDLAKRIDTHGGAGFIVDYGHDGSNTDTFRVSSYF